MNQRQKALANEAAATIELARLLEQIADARAQLSELQADLSESSSDGRQTPAAHLDSNGPEAVLSKPERQTSSVASRGSAQSAAGTDRSGLARSIADPALLVDRLGRALLQAQRRHGHVAVLFIQLSHFEEVGAGVGRAIGDAVLQRVAASLLSTVRQADSVSQQSDDTFVVLLPELSRASDALLVADKASAAISIPYRIDEHVVRLTATVGISLFPQDGAEAQFLLDRAATAACQAKADGVGRFSFHLTESEEGVITVPAALESLGHPLKKNTAAANDRWHRHKQLREANEQLIATAFTAQTLQAAAERVQRQQTHFLAVVAHEMRTPLAPLRFAAAALGKMHSDKPALPRVQAVIDRQVTHLSRMVEDLLDVSRLRTGKFRLERRLIQLSAVIDAAVDACRPAMDARLQAFSVQGPAKPVELDGDPIRLTQILTNLLDNASKYTPEHGSIYLAVTLTADAICMVVRDTGRGITKEALPTVFDPFVQPLEDLATGHAGGIGIGLTVVRELVAAHGGTVIATSPGKGLGTEITVTLPRLSAEG